MVGSRRPCQPDACVLARLYVKSAPCPLTDSLLPLPQGLRACDVLLHGRPPPTPVPLHVFSPTPPSRTIAPFPLAVTGLLPATLVTAAPQEVGSLAIPTHFRPGSESRPGGILCHSPGDAVTSRDLTVSVKTCRNDRI